MKELERCYLVSLNGEMIALIEIKDINLFDNENFLTELKDDGYTVQSISKTQKAILFPSDARLN